MYFPQVDHYSLCNTYILAHKQVRRRYHVTEFPFHLVNIIYDTKFQLYIIMELNFDNNIESRNETLFVGNSILHLEVLQCLQLSNIMCILILMISVQYIHLQDQIDWKRRPKEIEGKLSDPKMTLSISVTIVLVITVITSTSCI